MAAMAEWLSEDLDVEKLVPVLANVVSTITIASCMVMKVPQIIAIKKSRSGDGIYVQAMLMEIFGYTVMTLYNYASEHSVMTYLEYPILLVQTFMMLYYVLMFKNKLGAPLVPLAIAFYVASLTGFLTEAFSNEIISNLVPLCTPMSGFAKIGYIIGIVKIGNAENVSLATWIISVMTNVARIFTVYVDSADPKLMINFIVSSILSLTVLATAIYYKTRAVPTRSSRKRHSRRRSHND